MNQEEPYEIFTDASFDCKTKLATYGIVIKQENKIIKAFGKRCTKNLENSTECEIFAIFQAINIIESKLIKKRKIQKFWLRTDCKIAKDFFTNSDSQINIFKRNPELYCEIKETFKRVSSKMFKNESSFRLKWIPRELNKMAHKCSYSAFRSFQINKNCNLVSKRNKIIQFLQEFNLKEHKILIYLYFIANSNKNILKTQLEISNALEISKSSVNRAFKQLCNLKMLEKINNGKYRLLI